MEQLGVEILGQSEIKNERGIVKISQKHTLNFLGNEESGWAKKGVDILVTDVIGRRVRKYKTVNSRIITILMHLEEKLNIIQMYTSINGKRN